MSNLFGINGVRGVVNETLTSDVALKLGRAVGRYYDGPVAVAMDTRITADMIKNAVIAGLLAEGCDVFDLGIVPIPALQYFVKMHDDILGGVMITASHNTAEYNGIKCITSTGDELGDAGKKKIEENYDSEIPSHSNRIGTVTKIVRAGEEYVNAILENVHTIDIKRAKLRVVVDCANGASSFTTPMLLQRLGVYTVTLNANPQGEFPGRPSEPTEENLSDVIALIKAAGADLGVAHDLDGDRASFITGEGKFIEGDIALAIMAKFILDGKKGKVVTPISTSSVVEDVVKENG
ncbi:MAG: phosphoglucosamine mutase, partial [Candidatus Methanomethylophilaceae archaeon]|nr:phosphoglucosamine mutase [Candidatus Methanomethylophilaceae archaeon]